MNFSDKTKNSHKTKNGRVFGTTNTGRVCILGGGGYLGQHLARTMQNDGKFVVVLDLSFTDFPFIGVDEKKIERIKGSILDEPLLDKALQGCDTCFHIAAYGMTGGASLNYQKCHQINVQGTEQVIKACLNNGVKSLIYSSSVSVIFNHRELYYADESTPYVDEFLSPYAESKCMAEKLVLKSNLSGEFHTCALRFRGIYGPGELRMIQRTVELAQQGMIKATFEKSSPCYTQYVNVENCVQALKLASESLQHASSTAAGKVYNIVDDGPSVGSFKFWYPLMESFGVKPPKIRLPYWLVYFLAFLMELLYHIFSIEPLMTRMEVNLTAIPNTYSIENAKKDLRYSPKNNHDLRPTIKFYDNLRDLNNNCMKSNIVGA